MPSSSMIYSQCYQWPSPAAVRKSLEEVFGRTRRQRLSMIDSKTVRGGEARGDSASMRLLLQGFPAREMLFDGGTGGRMSVAHPPLPSRCGLPGAAVSHADSASLAQRHHSTYSGTLEAALQAEWCQIARCPTEDRSNTVVQPQATGPLSG
jgi:hypothetical protein